MKSMYVLVYVLYMRWGQSEECVLVCVLYMRWGQSEEYVLVCVLYMRWGQSEEYVLVCVLYMRWGQSEEYVLYSDKDVRTCVHCTYIPNHTNVQSHGTCTYVRMLNCIHKGKHLLRETTKLSFSVHSHNLTQQWNCPFQK